MIGRLRGSKAPKVTLVVVSFNMERELPRTLFTLSPPYQLGLDDGEIEVIVVDNGSNTPPDANTMMGSDRVLFVDDPTPSPARAVNLGLREARSDLIGVLIDGARMASPGLCRHVLMASTLSERPIIATLGFHLGPDVQMKSVPKGYCQAEEDRLLSSVDWQRDGYALFGISVFAGSSGNGWFAPMSESNALFMPRALWRELDGYDEEFAMPGGGLVNLDTYVRACELPECDLITLLGEGTFHQVHGGIATNRKDPNANWETFHEEYVRIRGKRFTRPSKDTIVLGTVPPQAIRSMRFSVDAMRAG